MKTSSVKELCKRWMEKTHQVAFFYPRLNYISVNGFERVKTKDFIRKAKEDLKN